MGKTFKAQVNKTIDLVISNEDIASLDIIKIANDQFHILHDQKSYSAKLIDGNFLEKEYHVQIDQNEYHIKLTSDLDTMIKELGFEVADGKRVKTITSPMPGMLLQVHVETGQTVNEDEPLFILEAMKMENIILSPINGTIKSVAAKEGTTVDKGQLIIEFE